MPIEKVSSVTTQPQVKQTKPETKPAEQEKEESSTGTYLLLGSLAALAVGTGVYFLTRGKTKSTPVAPIKKPETPNSKELADEVKRIADRVLRFNRKFDTQKPQLECQKLYDEFSKFKFDCKPLDAPSYKNIGKYRVFDDGQKHTRTYRQKDGICIIMKYNKFGDMESFQYRKGADVVNFGHIQTPTIGKLFEEIRSDGTLITTEVLNGKRVQRQFFGDNLEKVDIFGDRCWHSFETLPDGTVKRAKLKTTDAKGRATREYSFQFNTQNNTIQNMRLTTLKPCKNSETMSETDMILDARFMPTGEVAIATKDYTKNGLKVKEQFKKS